MDFDSEPEWMKKARQAPLRSTWDSRQPVVFKRHEAAVLPNGDGITSLSQEVTQ
jgi:hypothetical protein